MQPQQKRSYLDVAEHVHFFAVFSSTTLMAKRETPFYPYNLKHYGGILGGIHSNPGLIRFFALADKIYLPSSASFLLCVPFSAIQQITTVHKPPDSCFLLSLVSSSYFPSVLYFIFPRLFLFFFLPVFTFIFAPLIFSTSVSFLFPFFKKKLTSLFCYFKSLRLGLLCFPNFYCYLSVVS